MHSKVGLEGCREGGVRVGLGRHDAYKCTYTCIWREWKQVCESISLSLSVTFSWLIKTYMCGLHVIINTFKRITTFDLLTSSSHDNHVLT